MIAYIKRWLARRQWQAHSDELEKLWDEQEWEETRQLLREAETRNAGGVAQQVERRP